MDIALAFKYIFEDQKWVKKIAIYSLFLLLSFFILPNLPASGYYIRLIRQVRSGEDHKLPEWDDWGDLIKSGFKYLILSLIIFIPIYILTIIYLAVVFGPIVLTTLFENEKIMIISFPCMYIFPMVFSAVLVIYTYIFVPSATILFAQTNSIRDTLKPKKILSIVKNNKINYLIICGIIMAMGYVSGIGIIFFIVGMFVTMSYTQFVFAHLLGQLANKEFGTEIVKTEETDKQQKRMKKSTKWIIAIVSSLLIFGLCSSCSFGSIILYKKFDKAIKNKKSVYSVITSDFQYVKVYEDFKFEIKIKNLSDKNIKIEQIDMYNPDISKKININAIRWPKPEKTRVVDSALYSDDGSEVLTRKISFIYSPTIDIKPNTSESIVFDSVALRAGEYQIYIDILMEASPVTSAFYDINSETMDTEFVIEANTQED